jgi:superfamily I DNA/RNA helicase
MISPADWRPIGVGGMEDPALAAVRSGGSALVVAGPGTGKTELLGQRAAYLFETGACIDPRRILAISFKRDAATNLRDRVERRCGPALVRRFDSMTFDAFAKQLLDRFWRALPEHVALSGSYGIAPFLKNAAFADLQRSTAGGLSKPGHPAYWAKTLIGKEPQPSGIYGVTMDAFSRSVQSLCLHPLDVGSYAAFLQLVQLRTALISPTPTLGFAMIGRLAQAIVNANPEIRRAICATYSHIFLDEFQDTTSVQYGLIESIFKGSAAKLTAVGDDKQRIMGWAGARADAFVAFEDAFLTAPGAFGKVSLTRNYRSNERIVAILNTLKAHLAPAEPDFVSVRPAPTLQADKICAVLVAADADAEAEAIASHVAGAIGEGLEPRSIGLLVRQKSVDWEARIKASFDARGIAFRNEDRDVGGASIQDLMTESYSRIVVDFLELLTRRHGGVLWNTAMGHCAAVTNLTLDDDEAVERDLALRLDEFHRAHRMRDADPVTGASIAGRIAAIEAFLGLERLRGVAPQYSAGDLFSRIRAATSAFLGECAVQTDSWQGMLSRYRGVSQIPLMTITKSKGLEYDLVMLPGLSDSEWWSFEKDPAEGHSTFFVAASRARERLIMTRCGSDGSAKIREIFHLLDKAGVPQINA